MVTITIDDAVLERLQGLNRFMEFRDASGKVLGRFVPSRAYYRGRECPLSEEEIAWRKANKASISQTAEHFGISPTSVKRYCAAAWSFRK